MIKEGYKYRVSYVKHPQNKYTTFSVAAKSKNNKTVYYGIFVEEILDLMDDSWIIIKKIHAVSDGVWNDVRQLTVFCDVDIHYNVEEKMYTEDDIPF